LGPYKIKNWLKSSRNFWKLFRFHRRL